MQIWPWSSSPVAHGFPAGLIKIFEDRTMGHYLAATLLALCLFAAVGRASVFVLVTIPLAALVPAECFYITHFGGSPSSAGVIAVIAETGAAESREFISGNALAFTVAPIAVVVAGVVARDYLRRHEIVWLHRSRSWLAITLFAFPAITLALAAASRQPEPKGEEARWTPSIVFPFDVVNLGEIFPWGIPVRIADYVTQRATMPDGVRALQAFRFGATVDPVHAPRTVVLVIGESARADHFGINGYSRATTPRLSSMPDLLNFTHVASVTNQTRTSVPFMLTRIPAGSRLYGPPTERSIVSAFREAGYRTWWISNQQPSHGDAVISYFAGEADAAKFINTASYGQQGLYDESLLPELKTALSDPAPHRFIVLHTLGSHWSYHLRYPEGFDRYQPSMVGVVNSYDNSILYTDMVLAEIIEMMRRQDDDSVVLYVSDHGQTLSEGACRYSGHGIMSATNFHVPLFVWMSPTFARKHPEWVASMRRNADKPLSTSSVFPTLAELGALRFDGMRGELSLANPDVNAGRRLVSFDTREWTDLDHDLAAKDCAGPAAVVRLQAGPVPSATAATKR